MRRTWMIGALVVAALAVASIALASGRHHGGHKSFRASLSGFNEVPPILSNGKATVRVTVNSTSITYRLTLSGTFTSSITQSHLHFGQAGVNGSVFLFLCTNLGNGPAGTPACPQSGTVTRTVSAADIVGAGGQNVHAGSLDDAMRIIRSGDAYANVHTVNFPAGEVRGQVTVRQGH